MDGSALDVNDSRQILPQYGYVVLFAFVLAEQIGLPALSPIGRRLPSSLSSPHWVISNASTTTSAPLAAGFAWPVTSIVRVWLVAARLVALKTTAWTCSVGEYVSTSATSTPSRDTRAIPVWGPRKPIQSTAVPVKANVAYPPAVNETTAVPPLQSLGSA